jgi:hypothetical protein
MLDSNPAPSARRSVAQADVADSADRSVALWLRTVALGITAMVLGGGAIALAFGGSLVQAVLAAAAGAICVRRIVLARREEKRVFALAVKTMEDNRSS